MTEYTYETIYCTNLYSIERVKKLRDFINCCQTSNTKEINNYYKTDLNKTINSIAKGTLLSNPKFLFEGGTFVILSIESINSSYNQILSLLSHYTDSLVLAISIPKVKAGNCYIDLFTEDRGFIHSKSSVTYHKDQLSIYSDKLEIITDSRVSIANFIKTSGNEEVYKTINNFLDRNFKKEVVLW